MVDDLREESHVVQGSRAASTAVLSEQSVPSSEVRRRRSLYPMRTQRYKRLSAAREELNDALQDAISEREPSSDALASDRGGELTTANEDFTMITGESLASIKASMTMISSHDEGERSHVSVEHLTSSPPKVAYPDIEEQASEAKTTWAGVDQDSMNWKHDEPASSPQQMRDAEVEHKELESENQSYDFVEDEDEPEPAAQEEAAAFSDHERPASNHSSPTANHDTSQMEQDATLGAPDPSVYQDEADDDDIWAEEASRSIDESALSNNPLRASHTSTALGRSQDTTHNSTTISIPPIFSEQSTLRPPRAKLPRTWRRKSGGGDFSYADSPAHHATTRSRDEPAQANVDDAESGRSSGVLTPPSTDDDESRRKDATLIEGATRDDEGMGESEVIVVGDDDEEEQDEAERMDEDYDEESDRESEEGDISGFTNPNAADTQLEAHHRAGRGWQAAEEEEEEDDVEEDASSQSEGSNVATPDESGEDTGFFWQSNLPQVYHKEQPQPQRRRKPVDLSALLRMDSSNVDAEKGLKDQERRESAGEAKAQQSKPDYQFSPLRMQPVNGRVNSTSNGHAGGRLLSTPLRKSLLKSSKALDSGNEMQREVEQPTNLHKQESTMEESQPTVTDDSLASKASDQRQLLGEFRSTTPAAKKPATERLAVLRDDSHERSRAEQYGIDASHDTTQADDSWPEQSYEEHLNVASPQKIAVNFNDSTLSYQQQPSLLAPRRPVQPLFDKNINVPVLKPDHHSYPDSSKQDFSPGPPSITHVGRHPAAALQKENEGVFSRLSTSFWSAVATTTTTRPQQAGPPSTPAPAARTTEQTVSLSIRAHLRQRYGVLPASHPWTMNHMRTLHRLLNSLESGRHDSIVPAHTPLPPHLAAVVGTTCRDATGRLWTCSSAHAHVVLAFMQLLVAPGLYASMERGEVEWLGDAQAAHLRGVMGGRDGSEVCFKTVKARSGGDGIEWEWVLECLGCCVYSNARVGVRKVEQRDDVFGSAREAEFSVMGDGEGEGRVREWFERSEVFS